MEPLVRHEAISMRRVDEQALRRVLEGFVDDAHTKLTLEVVEVPRVAVSDHVRDRNTSVGPFGKQALKPRKPLRHKVLVFHVLVKHIANQIQRTVLFHNPLLVRPQQGNRVMLGGSAFFSRATPKVEIGEEQGQREGGNVRQVSR